MKGGGRNKKPGNQDQVSGLLKSGVPAAILSGNTGTFSVSYIDVLLRCTSNLLFVEMWTAEVSLGHFRLFGFCTVLRPFSVQS